MSDNEITSENLSKISVTFSILGYGLALLALEKADSENKDKKSMSAALNRLLKNSPVSARPFQSLPAAEPGLTPRKHQKGRR